MIRNNLHKKIHRNDVNNSCKYKTNYIIKKKIKKSFPIIIVLCCCIFLIILSFQLQIFTIHFNQNNLRKAITVTYGIDLSSTTTASTSTSSSIDSNRINPSSRVSSSSKRRVDQPFLRNQGIEIINTKAKVAILVIYTGEAWPNTFDLFLFSSQFSRPLCDWIFIVPRQNSPPRQYLPSNIKIIELDEEVLFQKLASLDDLYNNSDEEFKRNMILAIQNLIHLQPYMLVEFKPCLGFLFSEYLESYSHWAFADIDMVVGNINQIINTNMLDSFDIITFSFGDTFRLYMRGQLTLHRNTREINELWKGCHHFTHLHERLDRFNETQFENWDFESAEGCYSKVVYDNKQISFLVSASQISDAYAMHPHDKEFFILSNQLMRCYSSPLDLSNSKQLLHDLIVYHPSEVSNQSIGLITLDTRNYKCEYWFHPQYQVCLDILPAEADVIRVNGKLFYSIDKNHYLTKESSCRIGFIGHFQGWKKHFHYFATYPPSLDVNTFVITEFGVLPFHINTLQELNFENSIQAIDWKELYNQRYNVMNTSNKLDLGFCLKFNEDLYKCHESLHSSTISIFRKDLLNNKEDEDTRISLITIGRLEQLDQVTLDISFETWNLGPKYLIIASDKTSDLIESKKFLDDLVERYHDLVVVMVESQYHNESIKLIDNVLYNIGLELIETDFVCVLPSGFIIEYNDVNQISKQIHMQDMIAYIIPTFQLSLTNNMMLHSVFPPKDQRTSSSIASEHSKALLLEYSKYMDFLDYSDPVPLHEVPEEWLNEHSLMPPILFSRKSHPHGSHFLRFPEELSGIGCYGNIILRQLMGVGYELHWMKGIIANVRSSSSFTSLNTNDIESYGCIHGSHDNRRNIAISLNSYYNRLSRLRDSSLQDLYARQSYHKTFEEEQLKVLQ